MKCDNCGKKISLIEQHFKCDNKHNLCINCVTYIGSGENYDIIICNKCQSNCI